MFGRIREFVIKEFIEILRDRKSVAMLIVFPVFLLVLFAYASKTDIEDLPTVVLDMDRTPESRAILSEFFNTKYFSRRYDALSFSQLKRSFDSGEVFMGIVIPAGYSADVKRGGGRAAKIQIIIDGSVPPIAVQAANFSRFIAARHFAAESGVAGSMPGAGFVQPIDLRTRILYNPSLDAILFMIPGLVGFLLTFLTVQQSAMSVIREKEAGTFDQLLVTPLSGFEIIVAKLIPFGVISSIAVVLILLVSVYWFGMVIVGSLWLFALATFIFIVASLVFGFFISSVSSNQIQAVQMTIFYQLPSIILSGMYFPIFAMPTIFRVISHALPLRYFLVIMRGITLKGAGLAELWPQFAGLLTFLLIVSLLTMRSVASARKKG